MVILYLISFGVLWKLYTDYSKYVGLYLSVLTFFIVTLLPLVHGYKTPYIIKCHLIILLSFCIFIGILYDCTRKLINPSLTWLLRINIGVLFFSIDDWIIQGLLLFSAITTPYVSAKDKGIQLRSSFINKDVWVVVTGIILLIYYNTHVSFLINNSFPLVLFAILIPTLFHFINNKYLESRVMLLCLCMIFEAFKTDQNILKLITENIK